MKNNSPLVLLILISQLLIQTNQAQNQQNVELYIETGHSGYVKSVAISPDGKLIASSGFDGTIKLWSFNSGQELKTMKVEKGSSINSLVFSPDGKILASCTGNKINFWGMPAGKEIKTFQNGCSAMTPERTIAFLPDGQTLAVLNSESVKLISIDSGKELRKIEQSSTFETLAISPNGKTIAWGSDSLIKIWNIENQQDIKVLSGHESGIHSLAFSPDGKTLASGSNDNDIKFWSLQDGIEFKTLNGHSSSVSSVTFSTRWHAFSFWRN